MRHYILPLLLCACFASAQNSEPLTNDAIIKMVQAGVPTATIIRTIAASDRDAFSFLPNDLQTLTAAKVPDDVIKAMSARAFGRSVSGLPASSQRTTPAPAGANAQNPPIVVTQTPAPPQAASSEYQGKGMWDLDVSATAFIPHSSPSDTFGLAGVNGGYFVTRGSLISANVAAFFESGGQDVYLAGGYRYFFHTKSPRFFPYVGGSAGGNILHSGGSTNGNFLAQANTGIRYFVAHHVAIELGYTLDYVHIAGEGFADSSLSVISFGFVHTFGAGQ